MYGVALITVGGAPAHYRGVWPDKDIGEDTLDYSVFNTLSTIVRSLCNDSAKALSFSLHSR